MVVTSAVGTTMMEAGRHREVCWTNSRWMGETRTYSATGAVVMRTFVVVARRIGSARWDWPAGTRNTIECRVGRTSVLGSCKSDGSESTSEGSEFDHGDLSIDALFSKKEYAVLECSKREVEFVEKEYTRSVSR